MQSCQAILLLFAINVISPTPTKVNKVPFAPLYALIQKPSSQVGQCLPRYGAHRLCHFPVLLSLLLTVGGPLAGAAPIISRSNCLPSTHWCGNLIHPAASAPTFCGKTSAILQFSVCVNMLSLSAYRRFIDGVYAAH